VKYEEGREEGREEADLVLLFFVVLDTLGSHPRSLTVCQPN